MAKKLKMYVLKDNKQRVRVDKKSQIVDLMLLQHAPQWQEKWFQKNRGIIDSAKKKGRPIGPSDMLPVFHEVPIAELRAMKKALGLTGKGETIELWFDFVNIRGLVQMVTVIGIG